MARDERGLPTGTVTFLFTDVEGSTRLLHEVGADAYAAALADHRLILRDAFAEHGGIEVDTQGDAFFVAFPTAPGALAAARQATNDLAAGPIRVRIGLHTGTPLLTNEGYVGPDVHKGARIAAAGHGGQILVSAATATLVDSAGLRDLGPHRLRDLAAPERLFQADSGDHPTLRSLHATNLPIPPTPFLGRVDELEQLVVLLTADDARLITLTGPGGTGKTRVALQAAADAADDFPGGVWWLPLAPLRDPDLVLNGMGRVLDAGGDLVDYIGDQRLLFVLDNFEHLLPAAIELPRLIAGCPNLTLLVTSRERLNLAGEHDVEVAPLTSADSRALFRAVAPVEEPADDKVVDEICRRLDHLPLAIELAAARLRVLTPPQLLARLERRLHILTAGRRDAPERQRTLRATIEWSHDLLSEAEQRLFARFAVFRGGCTLEAALAVATTNVDELQALVDHSLVSRRDTGRFRMLETIREYAAEQLASSGKLDQVRRRHAHYFLALAESGVEPVRMDSEEWIERLEADHDNLRAALDYFSDEDGPALQRLAGGLARFWFQRSHLAEGRRRLEAALAADAAPTEARAACLYGLTGIAIKLGEHGEARAHATASLEIERRVGNPWGIAYATMMVGISIAEDRGPDRDLETAIRHVEESVRRFEILGDRHFQLIASYNRGEIAYHLGRVDQAKQTHLAVLETARAIGHATIEAEALAHLGLEELHAGRLDVAGDYLRQALRINLRRKMRLQMATQLSRLGAVLSHADRPAVGATLIGASLQVIERLGASPDWYQQARDRAALEACSSRIGIPATARALDRGRDLEVEEAVALALAPAA